MPAGGFPPRHARMRALPKGVCYFVLTYLRSTRDKATDRNERKRSYNYLYLYLYLYLFEHVPDLGVR